MRKNLVGAVPLIGSDLADNGYADTVKSIDPFQATTDAIRSAQNGEYAQAGVAAASIFLKPVKPAQQFIDPSLVRFTQDSIKGVFKNGGDINTLASALRADGGKALAASMEPIRLVLKDGQLYSLDNRRLAAFAAAGREVPYRMATQREVAKEWVKKFTTTLEQGMGKYITVRTPR